MSMFKTFSVDQSLEGDGVWIDYGDFRVKLARAGGSNREYSKVLERLSRPHRRAIATGAISDEQAQGMMHRALAEGCVKGWETRDDDGEWVSDVIEAPGGGLREATTAAIIETFELLPDLYADLRAQAESMALFKARELEAEAGN